MFAPMALIINGEHIDDEIIEAEFRHIKSHYERTLQVACCERDPEFRGIAKDNLISSAILGQESRRRHPEVDEADITARLSKLIANLKHYMTDEEIQASHITKSLSGASSRQEIYHAMRDIRSQLLAGADFAKLAEEHRSGEQQQIDLGWFKRGEFMEEFETIAFSMGEGEISPVFNTQLGFHVCTVTGRRPSVARPFDEVKEEVKTRFLEEYRDKKFNAFLEELKATAKVEDTDPPDEGANCGH